MSAMVFAGFGQEAGKFADDIIANNRKISDREDQQEEARKAREQDYEFRRTEAETNRDFQRAQSDTAFGRQKQMAGLGQRNAIELSNLKEKQGLRLDSVKRQRDEEERQRGINEQTNSFLQMMNLPVDARQEVRSLIAGSSLDKVQELWEKGKIFRTPTGVGADKETQAMLEKAEANYTAHSTPSEPLSFGGDIASGIAATAKAIGLHPVDLATLISYETAGTFDPKQPGPVTQHGQHRGFIQFGEQQALDFGVDWDNPIDSQFGENGAIANYFRARGFKAGMSGLDAYSTVNAGRPGLYDRTDENNGGAPGTVRDKWENQMGGHRAKAERLMAGYTDTTSPTAGYFGDKYGSASQSYTPNEVMDDIEATEAPKTYLSYRANDGGSMPEFFAPDLQDARTSDDLRGLALRVGTSTEFGSEEDRESAMRIIERERLYRTTLEQMEKKNDLDEGIRNDIIGAKTPEALANLRIAYENREDMPTESQAAALSMISTAELRQAEIRTQERMTDPKGIITVYPLEASTGSPGFATQVRLDGDGGYVSLDGETTYASGDVYPVNDDLAFKALAEYKAQTTAFSTRMVAGQAMIESLLYVQDIGQNNEAALNEVVNFFAGGADFISDFSAAMNSMATNGASYDRDYMAGFLGEFQAMSEGAASITMAITEAAFNSALSRGGTVSRISDKDFERELISSGFGAKNKEELMRTTSNAINVKSGLLERGLSSTWEILPIPDAFKADMRRNNEPFTMPFSQFVSERMTPERRARYEEILAMDISARPEATGERANIMDVVKEVPAATAESVGEALQETSDQTTSNGAGLGARPTPQSAPEESTERVVVKEGIAVITDKMIAAKPSLKQFSAGTKVRVKKYDDGTEEIVEVQ